MNHTHSPRHLRTLPKPLGLALRLALCLALCLACTGRPAQARDPIMPTPRLTPAILRALPHDPDSFVQGLLFHQGRFYESRGRYGESELRELDPESGRILRAAPLPDTVFAEGLALAGDRLLQLTWQEHMVFVWDAATFNPLGQLMFMGQGWGLTFDGDQLIASDGSDTLSFYAPSSLAPRGRITVTDQGRPVRRLNELEWVQGWILANVWQSTNIAVINPENGQVAAWIDCATLSELAGWHADGKDLNGIAANPETGQLWVTGKCWNVIYEIHVELPAH